MKRAIITGISGQDGSYLAEHLLERGYEVHGLIRRVSSEDMGSRLYRIQHLLPRLILHFGAIDNPTAILRLFRSVDFNECYHLAAQSYVGEDWGEGLGNLSTNIAGVYHLLDSIREYSPGCRFYFAGSSEMFGSPDETPQNEMTRFQPRNTYGISKVAGHHLVRHFRENAGLFASTGILFNHESPRRGREFVTAKVVSAAVRIRKGKQSELRLGDLDACRDWGHSRDYVRAMNLILQHVVAKDFVVATGVTHTVRELCELTFGMLGLNYQEHVVTDPQFVRGKEKAILTGDSSLAQRELGWKPEIPFADLVTEMVEQELKRVDSDA
jgi:GDPmannose 4,6-dehydratase